MKIIWFVLGFIAAIGLVRLLDRVNSYSSSLEESLGGKQWENYTTEITHEQK